VNTVEQDASWWEPQLVDRERWGTLAEPSLHLLEACRDRARFPHGLLLVGPAELGRELVAAETAAMLTCPEANPRWCDCGSCRRARRGVHPDVALVMPQGAARKIGIDQVREIVDAASGRPFEAARRVWILPGVEAGQLGAEAANAFLKTLEEPPEHVVFILLASNPTAVLPTIRSRCQQLVLPGPLVVASRLGGDEIPPELASAAPSADAVRRAREHLYGALGGETLNLVRLAYAGHGDPYAFQTAAAIALEVAAERPEETQCLVGLAADLLEAERLTRALNLTVERQLLACLLRWYGDRRG